MTNSIEEAFGLSVLEAGDFAELPHWHDLGIVRARTSPRLGYRGAIEVAGKGPVPHSAGLFLRMLLLNVGKPSAVRRWRLTRPDCVVIEGPFALETFAVEEAGFELLISCAGDLVESGERDPAVEAKRNEARIVALGEGATDAVRKVAMTLIQTRTPEVGLDEALSAVLAGGLTGLVAVMLAADPKATPDEVEAAISEAVSSIMGVAKNVR